jgi:hypothetical protein
MKRVLLLPAILSLGTAQAETSGGSVPDFASAIQPVLAKYCLNCHSTEKQKGDLDLESIATPEGLRRHPKIWQQVLQQVTEGEMPPKEKPQPAPEERAGLTNWVRGSLHVLAMERAGDPGPVVLRRLSKAEYTWTIRDLTGVPSLDPAREFPTDGAAGEGFSNTGQALVMSPSLITKYLNAAKSIASHAVLVPEGIRFSPGSTQQDWTNEILQQIKDLYHETTAAGGTLPLEPWLTASLAWRDGGRDTAAVAAKHHLSPKYLTTLTGFLAGGAPGPLLDPLRQQWASAQTADVPALATIISAWQKTLWKFSPVGHIGKTGGPKAWMEPVTPLVEQQEFHLKLPPAAAGGTSTIYLVTTDAGDGPQGDCVIWNQPKISLPGRPPVLLRDLRQQIASMTGWRNHVLTHTSRALAAAAEAEASENPPALPELAQRHSLDIPTIKAWFTFLGIAAAGEIKLDHLNTPLAETAYPSVKGWGSPGLPSLWTNSFDKEVLIPGTVKAHGVVVHPSVDQAVAVGWHSPITGTLRIEASVTDAHTACGNGVAWSLEWRRGTIRRRLAEGVTLGNSPSRPEPLENLSVRAGDLVSLIIRPRDNDHVCDLTDLEFKLSTRDGPKPQDWSLTREVAGDIASGNPHADQAGHPGVWHFYREPVSGKTDIQALPQGSLLTKWQAEKQPAVKAQLADAIQQLLTSPCPTADGPDKTLHLRLSSLKSPLLSGDNPEKQPASSYAEGPWGSDPASFGKHPAGSPLDPASLCVQAPSMLEITLPSELAEGCEFSTSAGLDPASGAEGSVQLQVLTSKPASLSGLQFCGASSSAESGSWNSSNAPVSFERPVHALAGSAARQRFASAFDAFREVFPAALCYEKIVPVDEAVTLTLFHREDGHLSGLMLDQDQSARLDQLWADLHFVSRDSLLLVDAFEQIWQYSTQDGPNAPNGDERLKPLGVVIRERAALFRQQLADAEPRHLEAAVAFASRAWRRPLSGSEPQDIRNLYQHLKSQELPHDEAIRLTLARILTGPDFLYKMERQEPGPAAHPLSDRELAARLSYFLWSSTPDAELTALAAAGVLHQPVVLAGQTRRMLADPRVRRLAVEFSCAWLHLLDFEALDEKSERHFPEFKALRGDMYEEVIRFFTDFFQENRPITSILDADHTFLNEALARYYGIGGVSGPAWRRVEGLQAVSRGGILGFAATLAKQSGASRSSPILRGNWVAEALLGDRLPRPPKDVPQLPAGESGSPLTIRQLTEKHSSDPRCYHCHQRIDAFGYALENFDAIGRHRLQDANGTLIDSQSKTMDGTSLAGLDGLRHYLLTQKRSAFLNQFCRKLLGYALGRSVQLSDEPLLAAMQTQLAADGYPIQSAVAMIISSRQFTEIRGRDASFEE